MCDRSLKYIVS